MRQGVQMEQTIRAGDLELVLVSLHVSQYTKGQTCVLAAMTPAPMLEVDCSDGHNPLIAHPGFYANALERTRAGKLGPRLVPLSRGWVGNLIDRVARERGRRELHKTFGVGIKALRAEPRYVLRGVPA